VEDWPRRPKEGEERVKGSKRYSVTSDRELIKGVTKSFPFEILREKYSHLRIRWKRLTYKSDISFGFLPQNGRKERHWAAD
jgi:hypothetical protein